MNNSIFPEIGGVVTALMLFGAVSQSGAQPTAFTYQGVLQQNGSGFTGVAEIQPSLWSAASGGTQIATHTPTSLGVAVTNGLFTATLDFGSLPFNGQPLWLQLAVRTTLSAFTTLVPRQSLTSTPYAIHSAHAASAATVSGNISAAQVTGTLSLARLPASVVTNGAMGVNISGTFSGDGKGVTNVDLALNSHGALSSAGIFKLASSLTVGDGPSAVTTADVNGDGKLDLISANINANTLSVLTNNGRGAFVLASSPSAGRSPDSLTAVDVNGDGKPDLICANPLANTLTVLTNDGRGGYVLAASPMVGREPRRATSADVNGDGKPDLISANSSDNTLTVLTNNGSGGFALASSPAVGEAPHSVAAVDVNGDGRMDLVSANNSAATLTVLTNDGRGNFVLASSPSVGAGPISVTAADVNGDGKTDLISANNSSGTLTVLTNIGSGRFELASSPAVGPQPFSVISADVNLDGNLDLISANYGGGTVTVLTNDGSGGFVLASSPVVGNLPFAVTAADLNGDGKPDLVCANQASDTLSVLFNLTTFTGDGSGLTFSGNLLVGGKLGIGTTEPGYQLDVLGAQAVGRFITTNSPFGAVLILGSTARQSNYFGAINFEGNGHTPGQIAYLSSNQMSFRVGDNERMTLDASGLRVNGTFVSASDRNVKQDFSEVDAQRVLEKVAALPLQSWSYTNRPGVKHVGPMAQDFRAAFGLGEDDTHIAMVDADGVALAAIQGLNRKLTEALTRRDLENAALKQRLENVEHLLRKEARTKKLPRATTESVSLEPEQ